jgi:Fic family protein
MTRQEEIAEMAEKAGQLVTDLENLKKQAGLYSAARENLTQTRESLVQLIGETKGLATETHKVLEKLNEIGAGKIFERLGAVEDRQKRMGMILAGGLLVLIVLNLWLIFRAK